MTDYSPLTRIGAVVWFVAGMTLATATVTPALADGGPCDAPTGPAQYPDKFDWNGGTYLFGDLYGVRKKATEGITLCSQYNSYIYDTPRGGLKSRCRRTRSALLLDRH